MSSKYPGSTAVIAGHPIHAMLLSFTIVCFVGTLLTDLVYWRTADMMWANFSAWLLSAGLVVGVLAAIARFVGFIGRRSIRDRSPAWFYLIGNMIVWILSFVNALVHSRDAWTSVVPTGLALSSLAVLVLLFTNWMGGSLVYRHRAGVAP